MEQTCVYVDLNIFKIVRNMRNIEKFSTSKVVDLLLC